MLLSRMSHHRSEDIIEIIFKSWTASPNIVIEFIGLVTLSQFQLLS